MDKNFKGNREEYLEYRKRRNKANKKYYAKPEVKQRIKKYKKEYDIKNREGNNTYNKRHSAIPRVKKLKQKWRDEHKEYTKEYNKKWRNENKEKKKEVDRQYFLNNREKVNKSQKKWRDKNKKSVKKYNNKYYTSPKGILNYTKQNHLRLSKKYGNEFKLNQKEIKQIFERDKVCVYCSKSRHLELDHIIPLSKGGKSIFNNFVIACSKCNQSKSARDVFKWCELKNIEVPKIIIELLRKQKLSKY